MQYEPVMRFWQKLGREVFYKLFFHTVRGGAALGYKPYPMAHAEYVCVYRHCRFIEYYSLYYVRSLASHAGEGGELFEGVRYFAAEVAA